MRLQILTKETPYRPQVTHLGTTSAGQAREPLAQNTSSSGEATTRNENDGRSTSGTLAGRNKVDAGRFLEESMKFEGKHDTGCETCADRFPADLN